MPWMLFLFNLWFAHSYPSQAPPLPDFGTKSAYRLHYQGSLLFMEGKYGQARMHFQGAYQKAPGNYSFAVAYGLSLGRTGKHQKANEILKGAMRNLAPEDPEYRMKLALGYFFQGASFLYSGRPARALAPLKKSIELIEGKAQTQLESLFNNALGYALLLDQGTGAHRKAGLPLHTHIHRRSLQRALAYFEKAMVLYPENTTTQSNYKTLADSLQINRPVSFARDSVGKTTYKKQDSPTFLSMHQTLFQDLKLSRYDELLFLVDISGSMVMEKVICMNATRFEVMKEMAQKILPEIPPYTRLGIATIGGDCGTVPKLWKATGSMDKKSLNEEFRFLIPDGTTPLLSMLIAAPELFSDSLKSSKSIFLISDGANTCRESGMDVCAWANQISRKNISVNILTFLSTTSNNTEAFAEYLCLAENTGGQVIYLDNYRCRFEPLALDLVKTCNFEIPDFQKSDCWGPAVPSLWMIRK